MVREYVSPQIKREKREKREKRDVGGGRVTSPARVGDGGSPSLSFSTSARLGVSTTVHGDSQLLDPGGGGSESSTIAAKDSEERRLFQLCAVVKFPGCRGVLGFLEESPSGTVEALRYGTKEFRFGPGICVSDLRFGNGERCGDATSSRHVSLVVEDGNTCPSSFNEEMCETASAFAGVS
ncbi:unnamed protein product [Brassica napus]|uniref:(rape) hypothetical protein n=1 Tax=Brassica napus TaxID=3708 RepID=A0A816VAN2_BRANA|nr:unnamed protein product [Brassica napus]